MGWAASWLTLCRNTTISFHSSLEFKSYSSSYFTKGGACEKLHVIEMRCTVIEMCDLI